MSHKIIHCCRCFEIQEEIVKRDMWKSSTGERYSAAIRKNVCCKGRNVYSKWDCMDINRKDSKGLTEIVYSFLNFNSSGCGALPVNIFLCIHASSYSCFFYVRREQNIQDIVCTNFRSNEVQWWVCWTSNGEALVKSPVDYKAQWHRANHCLLAQTTSQGYENTKVERNITLSSLEKGLDNIINK